MSLPAVLPERPATVLLDETIMLGSTVWRVEAEVTLGEVVVVDITGASGHGGRWYFGWRFKEVISRLELELVETALVRAAREVVRRGALKQIP